MATTVDETFADTLPDVFGWVTFCDDVRFELTNKTIAVGIYNSAMQFVGNFPFQLKSFGLIINYVERIGTQTEPVKIKVTFPGTKEPLIEIPIPIEQVRSAGSVSPDPDVVPRFHSSVIPIAVGPLIIPEKGNILVVAWVGDKPYRLGILRVFATPTMPEMAASQSQAIPLQATGGT